MTKKDITIDNFDFIGAGEAMEILELKHRNIFAELVREKKIPHKSINTRKIFLRGDIEEIKNSRKKFKNLDSHQNITELDLIGTADAMKIFNTKNREYFYRSMERYEIKNKKLPFGYIFLRSDVEAAQNSDRRQRNLKHRKKDKK